MSESLALTAAIERSRSVLLNRWRISSSSERAPWKLAKQDESDRDLDSVLYHLAESLRIIAILISPVLPKAAHGIFDQLNWKMELSGKEERFSLADAEWGRLPDGHVVGKPVPLFPRIESDFWGARASRVLVSASRRNRLCWTRTFNSSRSVKKSS